MSGLRAAPKPRIGNVDLAIGLQPSGEAPVGEMRRQDSLPELADMASVGTDWRLHLSTEGTVGRYEIDDSPSRRDGAEDAPGRSDLIALEASDILVNSDRVFRPVVKSASTLDPSVALGSFPGRTVKALIPGTHSSAV